jgi:hypothetical protein
MSVKQYARKSIGSGQAAKQPLKSSGYSTCSKDMVTAIGPRQQKQMVVAAVELKLL